MHEYVPGPIRGSETCQQVWLARLKNGFSVPTLVKGLAFRRPSCQVGHHDNSAGHPNTGTICTAMGGHVEPVAVPVVLGVGKLATVDPELEADDLQGRRPEHISVLCQSHHG